MPKPDSESDGGPASCTNSDPDAPVVLGPGRKSRTSWRTRFRSKVKDMMNWVAYQIYFRDLDPKGAVHFVMSELEKHGSIKVKPEERQMMTQLLDFYEYSVEEIKVPRNEILALEESDLDRVFDLMEKSKVSRVPVYRKNLDNIIGFINIKDMFVELRKTGNVTGARAAGLIKKILFVPPSMKAIDLLARMKKTKIQIAVIVDEYGGTDGLITIKNIIAEVVGMIDEEEREEEIRQLSPSEIEASGRVGLEVLREKFGFDLLDMRYDDVETLNGLVLSISGIVPETGSWVDLPNGFRCKILEASDRMVIKALVVWPEKSQDDGEAG